MMDYAFLFVYLLTEFVNYLSAYVVIFGCSLTKNKKRSMLAILIIILIHFLLLHIVGRGGSSALSLLTMIVIPLALLEPMEKKNFFLYPFVAIGTSVVGVCVSFLVAIIIDVPEYVVVEGNWLTILCQSVQGIVLLLLLLYKKVKGNESYEVYLDKKQYILLYIVVICLFLMLAPMQELTRGTYLVKNVNVIGFAVSVASIVLVIITLWQGIVVNREIQLKERDKMNEKFVELKKEYYAQLLEQDEKMRRFRHDMNAHMIAIRSYCEQGNNTEMQEYLNNIIKGSAIYEVQVYTGNKSVDAIIRQLYSEADQKQVKVEIVGGLLDNMVLSEYDLCTIVYNLLKNAIEACERIDNISKRKVIMKTGIYNSRLYLTVKNTVKENVVIKGNSLLSTKDDRKYHGFGSKNVEHTINKYQGTVEYICEDGWFIAEVSI